MSDDQSLDPFEPGNLLQTLYGHLDSSHVHIDEETARRFLHSELTVAARNEVLDKVVACRECRHTGSQVWQHLARAQGKQAHRGQLQAESRPPREPDQLQRFVRQEEREAPRLLEELMSYSTSPRNERMMRAAAIRKYHTWGFAVYLLDRSWQLRFDNAEQTLHLAELATVVTDELPADRYGHRLKADLRARAWAHHANAHRILSNYEMARSSFEIAEGYLSRGTGAPIERANLLLMKGSFYWYQQEFETGERAFNEVEILFELTGDRHRAGLAIADKGAMLVVAEDYPRAVRFLRQSLEKMDPERDTERILATWHNLASALIRTGDARKAQVILDQLRPLYEKRNDRLNLARLAWLGGQVHSELHDLPSAIHCFKQAKREFFGQGIGYDAAEACLELAAIYAVQGQAKELRSLADQMVPLFHARDMHQYAVAAIFAFQRAVETNKLTLEFVDELRDYWKMARNRPNLKFDCENYPGA